MRPVLVAMTVGLLALCVGGCKEKAPSKPRARTLLPQRERAKPSPSVKLPSKLFGLRLGVSPKDLAATARSKGWIVKSVREFKIKKCADGVVLLHHFKGANLARGGYTGANFKDGRIFNIRYRFRRSKKPTLRSGEAWKEYLKRAVAKYGKYTHYQTGTGLHELVFTSKARYFSINYSTGLSRWWIEAFELGDRTIRAALRRRDRSCWQRFAKVEVSKVPLP